MTTNMKLILGIVAIICIGVIIVGLNTLANPSKEVNTSQQVKMIERVIPEGSIPSSYLSPTKKITVHATEPKTPQSVTIYKGVFRDGDKHDVILGDSLTPKNNVISEKDAPEAAQKVIEQYGGLPTDAELGRSETRYLEKIRSSTGEVVEKTPVSTGVYYIRKIDGMPVVGMSDKIIIELGESGALLRYYKIWRTLEPLDTKVSVISPDKAADKLRGGQILDPPLGVNEDVNINEIKLGYYETSREDPEIILQPVWIFYGKTTSGSEIKYDIYARQFAAFTQKPVVTLKTVAGITIEEKDPFTATFTDTSDANPTKWLWDFGDGSTSTEQNPTHTYKAAGTYDVTLTVWNDLGSDTITHQYVVDAVPEKKPEVTRTVTIAETISDRNETVATVTATPSATVFVTGNETAVPTTTITANTTIITTVATETVTITPTASVNET